MSTKAKTEIDLIDRVGGLRSEPGGRAERPAGAGATTELPQEVRDRLSDEVIDELLAGARTEEEVVGRGGLHNECDRSVEPAAAESDQDERTLPQRGGRPQTHLPRHRQRRPGVDANAQLDDRVARVQDPLRRPTTQVNRLHRNSDALSTTRSVRRPSGIVSPGCHSGATVVSLGGSAGVPSTRRSSNVDANAIRFPSLGPDGLSRISRSASGAVVPWDRATSLRWAGLGSV
jgi:hypothetical protein